MYITVAHWLGVQMEATLIHVHHSGTVAGGTDGGNVDTCTSQWHTGWGYRWGQG